MGNKRRKNNKRKNKNQNKNKNNNNNNNNDDVSGTSAYSIDKGAVVQSPYSCTGSLRKQSNWWDIHIDDFSLSFHGKELIGNCQLVLNSGRRYGLIGPNGSGKSTLLNAIGIREAELPPHIDIFHVRSEIEASDKTAMESVLEVDQLKLELETEADRIGELLISLTGEEADAANETMLEIYEKLDFLGADTAEARACKILSGLGFTKEKQNQKTKEFSGGWRMRIALARALFIRPTLLLLDEPTNHLDMESCVWLEEYLMNWNSKGILLLVSHSQDFMNGVCTNIIHLHNKRLNYYSGNFDQFCITRGELEEHQMKNYKSEQDQIKAMKEYIARFGHGSAKLARQAKSKEKTLARMQNKGLTQAVVKQRKVKFDFHEVDSLPPPVLVFQGVSFGYPGCDPLYTGLEFGVDLDSRIALVGQNGTGKTTLLKLMCRELEPTEGMVQPHNKLRIARFTQHFVDILDLELTPLRYLRNCWPEEEEETVRAWLGRFGISGNVQTQRMLTLSDGQKSRVVLCWMTQKKPHILLLDEPTNHLDMESIDALGEAINGFNGGVVLVSHDMRLISVVAEELWLCENNTVKKYQGSILDYKNYLKEYLYEQHLFDD